MKISSRFQLLVLLIISTTLSTAQVYPPDQQLVYNSMPNIAKPAYLAPITDPIFGTTVVRISDQTVFNTHYNGLSTYHHYSKSQSWNSDGTMIKLHGWPSAILDGNTYQFIKTVTPPGGHHTWSNTQPNIIYGSNNPNYDGNCIAQLDVSTNTRSLVACFNQYSTVSMGDWEGNISNDDRYMALQCNKTSGGVEIACYDFVTNSIVATINGNTTWPNNVTMSQSGNYIVIQWGATGTASNEGIWVYNRNNISNARFLSNRGGNHYDLGYDTQGNEVIVGTLGNSRRLQMIRLDNGATTNLLSESQMGWPLHVSCRNINRPGWAYISEFEASYGEPSKPYYQKVFAVKLDPGANESAVVQVFAQPHHSTNVNYDRSTFGTPNRDGTKYMFRSDWMGSSSSEINSYVAFMPGNPSCSLSCTATQTSPASCGNNNGQASASPANGTAPYIYLWSDSQAQTTSTANGLAAGSYTVNITDANNCSTSCTVTITGANSPTCTATQTNAPTCGNNDGSATATAQGGTTPYSYSWNDGQTSATAINLSAGTYTVVITDANNCSTSCTVTLTDANGGGGGAAFANVTTQASIAWNGGAQYANRAKPALGVWEPGDAPGTEIMRVSDASGNGLHYYNSRQVWNIDMTKMMIGDGVIADNKLLDATNNYALLPTRIPLNSHRVWSNTNPDFIYGIRAQTEFCRFNVSTGVTTVLFTRGTIINIRSKGNLPGDDSKIALYEPSTNRIISFNIQTNSIIAEIIWPNGNISAGGGYVSYDWSGNWVVVGMGDGSDRLYRMTPNLTNITQVHNQVRHSDFAYNTAGESVQVLTRYNGSVQVVNIDDPSKNYISSVFGGANPNTGSWTVTPDYISGRGQTGSPGWIVFSGEPGIGSPNHPLGLLKLDGNTNTSTIKVIGYDHHSSAPAISNGGNDDRQKASVSPDGNQVIFTSDWGVPNGPLSSYIIRGTGGGTANCNVTCTASQTVAPTCGGNNGEATVVVNGGTTPYSYSWNDGQTTPTAVGLGAGTYSMTVTDANNSSSTCTVTLVAPGLPTCTATETTGPTCGANNGEATVSAQGGVPPYTYLWNDTQAQTSAVADNLTAGNYIVVVTDANGCTTQCSITLIDASGLSCTIEATTPPSSGGSDGVATVTPSGGTVTTGDPRTDLLASPDHIGYGAAATGGTNYVYVTNFTQLKNAMENAGNYVLLDPSLSGQGIGFTSSINVASNTTLDGSLAPGSWFFPNYSAGYSANTSMFNHYSTNNNIIHSVELRGNRVTPYNGNHPSANAGAFNIRGANVWYDHVTITDFWGQSLMLAQGGNNVSLSNMKIVNTENGLWLYFANYTPRYVSLFNSEINAKQLTPYNEGASHFHMWNNFIHGAQYGAAMTGVAESNTPGQNGPVRTLSEHNVFSNNSPVAEHGFPMGHSYGGPVQLPGFVYTNANVYNNGDVTSGNIIAGNAPWTIPYSYTLLPASQVEDYVAENAGKIIGGGSVTYSYQWDDPAGQTTAIATGLTAGTYQVTVSDATGCTTVCSITMPGTPAVCNVGVWLEGALDANMGMMNNSLQQIGVLPSGQPYGMAPWNYNGNEGAGWQQSDYPAGSLDWVLLSFRTTPQPGSEVAKVAALLMDDGNIVPASVELSVSGATSYYIVVEHRNHLPAMSSVAVPLLNNTLNYDFRPSNSYSQGTGFGQTQLGTEWAMFAGEADQSSTVGYEVTGADLILWQAANGNFSTYMAEDINMDGDVNGLDRLLLNLNNGISSSVMK